MYGVYCGLLVEEALRRNAPRDGGGAHGEKSSNQDDARARLAHHTSLHHHGGSSRSEVGDWEGKQDPYVFSQRSVITFYRWIPWYLPGGGSP
jgi:hypothetical protein